MKMYKRITISILLLMFVFVSGCLEVGYKSEVTLTLGKPAPKTKESVPEIIGYSYPQLVSRLVSNEVETSKELEEANNKQGFAKFNN